MALILKKLETVPTRIEISIGDAAKPSISGFITAHAIVRSRESLVKLQEDMEAGKFDNDLAVLHALYTKLEGLGTEDGPLEGEAAFVEATTGEFSFYLTPALIDGYFAQYKDARVKNSVRSRGR